MANTLKTNWVPSNGQYGADSSLEWVEGSGWHFSPESTGCTFCKRYIKPAPDTVWAINLNPTAITLTLNIVKPADTTYFSGGIAISVSGDNGSVVYGLYSSYHSCDISNAGTYTIYFELSDNYIPDWGDGTPASLACYDCIEPYIVTLEHLGITLGADQNTLEREFTITKIVIDSIIFELEPEAESSCVWTSKINTREICNNG